MNDIKAHISRLPEGGASVLFVSGERRASLDVYDSGENVGATYYSSNVGDPEIWIETGALARALERILDFLSEEPSK